MEYTGRRVTTFQQRLCDLIAASPLNDTQLAAALRISKQTLSAWKCGVRSPKEPTARSIAQYFHVSVDWLKGFDVPRFQEFPEFRAENLLPMPEMQRLPLLGAIACGLPILADENIEGWVDVPADAHGSFVLRCQGDSMRDARIMDGDLVCIRQQDDVQDGQIAAVLIDDAATLKRVHHLQDGSILLQAANSAYPPMIYGGPNETHTVRILGLATYFISKVS